MKIGRKIGKLQFKEIKYSLSLSEIVMLLLTSLIIKFGVININFMLKNCYI